VLFAPAQDDTAVPVGWPPLLLAALAGAVASVPVIVLLIPYALHHQVGDWITGTFVLPQKRLAFASMSMPGWTSIVPSWPVLAVFVLACAGPADSIAVAAAVWAAAVALPLAAVRYGFAYQAIWESARALGALIPIGIAWLLLSRRVHDARTRSMLFAAAAVLAWASLNQYPFSAPIYFCYTTPLIVVAAVTAADGLPRRPARVLLPFAVMFGIFGIAIADRGDLYTLSHASGAVSHDAPLDLPRAHLYVSEHDASVYRRLIASVVSHYRGGTLIAGPDCPEVYFLAGLRSPSGALFDFFSESRPDDAAGWLKADVIIVNHQPGFSPPPSAPLMATLRREFPQGEEIERFEVRWR
jgi:hypothetical protein